MGERWSLIIGNPTMSECKPKSFNQSKCFQVPSKLCTGHHIEWWYHRWSNEETKDCHKMINFPVASWSYNQSDDHQIKDEFHKPLPKRDGYDNSIISEWKYIDYKSKVLNICISKNHYRFLSAKDFLDNISVTEAVLFFISNITADVKNISKMLEVNNASKTKYPWHKDLPMMLSYMQNFFMRLYPPGIK